MTLTTISPGPAWGTTPDPDSFFFKQARKITIDADPPQHVIGAYSSDGELWGETPISAKVLPQAVRFVVPEERNSDQQWSSGQAVLTYVTQAASLMPESVTAYDQG